MKYFLIICSTIIYILTLFLFKTVLQGILAVVIFQLGLILVNKIFEFPKGFVIFTKFFKKPFLTAILSLSFYYILSLPLEFLFTETWFKIAKFPDFFWVFLLSFLVFVLSLINWDKYFSSINFYIFFLFIFYVSSFVYIAYQREKNWRQNLPKIYKISPDWGIQQMEVEINGKNFGPIWKKGKIVFDGGELRVLSWGEEKILMEVPVPPKFGLISLFIVREDEVASNKVPFELRDPKFLKN